MKQKKKWLKWWGITWWSSLCVVSFWYSHSWRKLDETKEEVLKMTRNTVVKILMRCPLLVFIEKWIKENLSWSLLWLPGNRTFITRVLITVCIPFHTNVETQKENIEKDALEYSLPIDSVHVSPLGDGRDSFDFGYSFIIHFIGAIVRGNSNLMKTDLLLSGLNANGNYIQ